MKYWKDTPDDLIKFAEELNEFLKKLFDYKVDLITISNKRIIVGRAKVSLMLRWTGCRYFKDYPNAIILASISFNKERKGYLTKILKFLLDKSLEYDYDSIVVESVLSDSMLNFTKKFNFKEIENYERNYGIYFDELEKYLKV